MSRSVVFIIIAVAAAVILLMLYDQERMPTLGDGRGKINIDASKSAPTKPANKTQPDGVVAVVNGRPISDEMLQLYAQARQQQSPYNVSNRTDLIAELVNLELLAQEAQRRELQQKPVVAAQLEFQRTNLLASAMIERYMESNPITDQDILREYHQRYPASAKEYQTRHILVKDAATAKTLIRQLNNGAEFAALAQQHSTGPSAEAGGLLEWFHPDQVIEEYAEAAKALSPGQFTLQPIKTRYGWHVIKLEQTRQAEQPPLSEISDELRNSLMRNRLEKHFKQLKKDSDVELR